MLHQHLLVLNFMSTNKVSYHQTKDLGFNFHLHQKSIGVLVNNKEQLSRADTSSKYLKKKKKKILVKYCVSTIDSLFCNNNFVSHFFYSQSDGLTMGCLVLYGGRNFFPKIYIVDITKSCSNFFSKKKMSSSN